jgi:hypothetical protein
MGAYVSAEELYVSDESAVQMALARFLMENTPASEFESWVYQSRALERVLGAREFTEIIAHDFRTKRSLGELRARLQRVIERLWPGMLDRFQARAACQGIIAGTIDLVRGCQVLARLAAKGVDGVPFDFVAWDDEFDGMPTADQYTLWDPNALKAKLALVGRLRREIIAAAEAVLEHLATGQR